MKNLLAVLVLFFSLSLNAQNLSLSGTVTDAKGGEPLPGAHIQLADRDTGKPRAEVSGLDGKFRFDQMEAGDYTLKISYLGFLDFTREISLEGQSIDLGALRMEEDAVRLGEVLISEQALPAQQKGDTTEINANAFKTLPDASAEDLITKMPTVTMQNGKIQAQGEEVKQVLVDGKPFFGNDPTAALRSLPAEVVDKIQVFDQQSDQAQFTGFQDGETSKTINIITKPSMKAGQFGKIYAGYGYPDLYQAGGQVNIFKKDRRISLIGMSNNINQQNFSTEDLLGVVGGGGQRGGGGRGPGGGGPGGWGPSNDFTVSQSGGITQTHAVGVNFSDKWFKKMDVSASYFFNWSDNSLEKFTDRQFVNTGEFQELYSEEAINQSTNINHRFNGRFEYKIDSLNTLTFRPRASWQSNKGESDLFGKNLRDETTISETTNNYLADLKAVNASGTLIWQHKFAKDRRTLSSEITAGYAPKRGESFLYSQNNYFDGAPSSDTLDQFTQLESYNWNGEIDFDYTEPIGKNGMLMATYEVNWKRDDSDREAFDFLESSQSYSIPNNQLTNVFTNDYVTHQAGGGYNYRKDQWTLMLRANYQRAELVNEQTSPENLTIKRSFDDILPMAMIRYEKSRNDNFRIFYRSSTRLPSIEQMQNVLNNTNPLQLSVGNPNLVQAVQHNVFGRYSKTNTEKSTVLFLLIGGGLTDDYIGNSTFLPQSDHPIFDQYEVSPGAQISTPANLDGYRNARAMLNYGFPVKPLKLNLNFDLSGNYSRTPGLVDEVLNFANNTNGGLGLTIGSNISDKLDFSVSSRTSYNWVTNTLQTNRNSNFLSQSAQLKFNWIIWKGITFRSDVTYQYFDGLSEDFDPNYWLWNMSIGKKILKNDRGEISLSVFDLLKQNNSLSRTITEVYYEDVQTTVLQQFFMLNFVYQIRNFGQAPEPPKEEAPRHMGGPWH
ncbi:MAG: TonB-dependent receptor [Saprospirales bacterium]|nr:TonB-dependent receptor [Saprospirales bacterium]